MKVTVRVHLRVGGGHIASTVLGPSEHRLRRGDALRDLAVDEARHLLTAEEFSRNLHLKHYFVAVREEGRREGPESDLEAVFDVYCVKAEPSSAGVTRGDLVADLGRVFGLSEVREDAVVCWKAPPGLTGGGGASRDHGKGFVDCDVSPETLYLPGSAFLVTSRASGSSSFSSTCSPSHSPPAPIAGGYVERFGEAHRETEGGPTSVQEGGQSLVGGIQHKTQSLAAKAPSKSDTSRRRDTTTAARPPSLISLPPTQSHKELTDGAPQLATPNTTAKREGKSLSHLVQQTLDGTNSAANQLNTPRVGSPAVGQSSLRQDGVKDSLKDSEKFSDGYSLDQRREEDGYSGGTHLFKQERPAMNTSPSPPQKTAMTNGLSLLAISMSSGVAVVPGVKSSKIPQDTAKGETGVDSHHMAENITRVSLAPTLGALTPRLAGGCLENAKSCDTLQVTKGADEGETRGERKKEEGRRGGGGDRERDEIGKGPEEQERGRKDGPAVSPLAVKSVQELTGQVNVKAKPGALSQNELELKRVHALEHACNYQDRPCLMDQNQDPCCYDQSEVDEIRRVLSVYRKEGGSLDEEVRTLIRRHCLHCREPNCRVPHAAAGCSPAGTSYTLSASLLGTDSHTSPSPHPPPVHGPFPPVTLPFPPSPPVQDTSPPPTSPPPPPSPCSQGAHPLPSPPHQPVAPPDSVVAPIVVVESHLPPKAVGTVSFDIQPANYSESPMPKSPVQTSSFAGPPTTLHTISDSPRHHVTHIPAGPAHPPGHTYSAATSAMVVGPMPMPRTQLESTFYQGTFPPTGVVTTTTGSPTVAQATEDAPIDQGKPRPQPEAPGGILPLRHCLVLGGVSGRFPNRRKLLPYKVLFSRRQDVIVGSDMWLDGLDKSPLLGRGGNGRIYKHPLLNEEYAVKLTLYRASELSEWRRFDHPNITALLMVTSLELENHHCCQFMTLMEGNLRGLIPSGGVCSLYAGDEEKWAMEVMPNVRHIVRGVVQGTAYLHENMSIQHVDLKATNVLIKRRCGCVDVFKCFCREDHKCLVKLADFDSVKPFQSKEFHGWHMEWWPYVRMSPEECEAVMGTPGYRAPEQFMKLAPVVSPSHLFWGKSLEGSWSDIWSLGLLVLSLFLGPNTHDDRHEAWTVFCQPNMKGFSRKDVIPELIHAQRKTMKLCMCNPRHIFTAASHFVTSCIEAKFFKRPTALELIDHELLMIE